MRSLAVLGWIGFWWCFASCAVAVDASSATAQEEASVWLVHITRQPIEATGRRVEALNGLAQYLDERLAGKEFEFNLFRRRSDATEAYAARSAKVDLILADPALFLDLPDMESFVPLARFVRDGKSSWPQLLVVKADRQLSEPKDLRRSGSLTVVETTGSRQLEVVSRAFFSGLIDATAYFAEIRLAPDDFSATADVLYGETDAALVSEFNPLLQSQLDDQLQALYVSEPLSLPILAVRRSAFAQEQRQALRTILSRMTGDVDGRAVLEALQLDGFEVLDADVGFETLIWPAPPTLAPQIATPSPAVEIAPGPLSPTPDQLEWMISVELPSLPLPAPNSDP